MARKLVKGEMRIADDFRGGVVPWQLQRCPSLT
jgi:hypothetical protein